MAISKSKREEVYRKYDGHCAYCGGEKRKNDDKPTAHLEVARWKYFRKQGIAVCTACSFERKLDDNFGKAVACPNCGASMED